MAPHDLRIAEILEGTSAAESRFRDAVRGISDSAALLPGQGGGWNAAEIAMHVAITNEWIAGVLSGEIQSAQPAPAGFRENWDAIVIPDTMKTFPSLVPPGGVTRQQALNHLTLSDESVQTAIRDMSEARAQHVVILPFGTLSLYQVAEFAGMHTNRHMMQLERLQVTV